MKTFVAVPVTAVLVAVAPVCPRCGMSLPLPRRVLAARLRCPESACGARLKLRGGRVLAG